MSELNLDAALTVSPRKARSLVKRIINAGHIPNIEGPPGTAKTAIAALVAQDLNLKLLDVSMTSRMLEDFTGFMNFTEDGRAEMVPLAGFIPMMGYDDVPDGFDGWLVFLDELPNASKDLKKACYKLLHQRLMGDRLIHPKVRLMVAGNRASDGAAAEEYDNGLKSRLSTITIKAVLDEWLEDMAYPNKYDRRLIGYLSSHSSMLHKMDNAGRDLSFPNLRTWSRVADILKDTPEGKLGTDEMILFNGIVGQEGASGIVAFSEVFDQIPTPAQLLDGTAELPEAGDLQWATMVTMLDLLESEEVAIKFQPIVAAMDAPTRTLFIRMAESRLPELHEIPAYAPLIRQISRAAAEARI